MKIISGGQTGADQGGLVAGRQLGFETGGWMPRGFLTEAGPCPALREVYGMQEHPSPEYRPRTRQNVKDADGTVWFGKTKSRGYQCTARATEDYEKPFIVNPTSAQLRDWADGRGIKILNVAGNRESTNRGIHQTAAETVIKAFREDL